MAKRNLDFTMHPYCDDIGLRRGGEKSENGSSPPLSTLSSWTPLFRNDSTNSVMVLKEKMVFYDISMRRVLAGVFKSTIGASGLSGDVQAMHAGRMLALNKLNERGCISLSQYLLGISTEMVKYPIRVLRVSRRARSGK